MLLLLTLALTSGSRVFEYEYDGERKLSNPSKTSKLGKSEAGPKLVAYNTLDGELMELIESSYEEAFDHDDINELERPLSFKKADAQIKRGKHSGRKVKVERKGALGAKRRRKERQKEGGEDYQDDHQVKRGKKKKERRKGGVDYQDDHQVKRGKKKKERRKGGVDYQDDHQVRRGKKKKERRKGGVDYQEEIWKNKCSLPDLGTKKEEKQVDIPTKKKK